MNERNEQAPEAGGEDVGLNATQKKAHPIISRRRVVVIHVMDFPCTQKVEKANNKKVKSRRRLGVRDEDDSSNHGEIRKLMVVHCSNQSPQWQMSRRPSLCCCVSHIFGVSPSLSHVNNGELEQQHLRLSLG
jgi:hypothetical protein